MTTADEQARYLPYWKCVHCGFRVFESAIELAEQVCGCGKGQGYWQVENGDLLQWAEKALA